MSMIDRQQAFNNQVSDFLKEFKHRFSILSHQGMPGKVGYTTKLQRKENCSLNVYLTENFPLNPPIMYVTPKIDSLLLDEIGRVKDPAVSFWNINSTLVNSIRAILVKLEESTGDIGMSLGMSSSKLTGQIQPNFMNAPPNYQNQNTYSNNLGQQNNNNWYSSMYTNNNVQQQDESIWQSSNNMSNTTSSTYTNNFGINQPPQNQNLVQQRTIYSDLNNNLGDKIVNFPKDQKLDSFKIINNNIQQPGNQSKSNSIENDLMSKSIEEIIYIYHNQEEYVSEFMEKHKSSINALKNDVDKLYSKLLIYYKGECSLKRQRYEREVQPIEMLLNDLNASKEELRAVQLEKMKYDSKFSIDNLIDKLSQDLKRLHEERQKVISEFFSKKLNFEEFVQSFKQTGIQIHTLMITKEKLYQYKNNNS